MSPIAISPENDESKLHPEISLRPMYTPPTFINPFYLNPDPWHKYFNFAPTLASHDKRLSHPQMRPTLPYSPIYILMPMQAHNRYFDRYISNEGYNRKYNIYKISDDSSEEMESD